MLPGGGPPAPVGVPEGAFELRELRQRLGLLEGDVQGRDPSRRSNSPSGAGRHGEPDQRDRTQTSPTMRMRSTAPRARWSIGASQARPILSASVGHSAPSRKGAVSGATSTLRSSDPSATRCRCPAAGGESEVQQLGKPTRYRLPLALPAQRHRDPLGHRARCLEAVARRHRAARVRARRESQSRPSR